MDDDERPTLSERLADEVKQEDDLEPLSDREREVIEALRDGDDYRRLKKTVHGIEDTLTLYEVPIDYPLSDSVLRVCEHNEKLRELLVRCKRVIGSDDLFKEIEEALDDLP